MYNSNPQKVFPNCAHQLLYATIEDPFIFFVTASESKWYSLGFDNGLCPKAFGIIGLEAGISEVLKNIALTERIVRLKRDSPLGSFMLVPRQVL